MKRKSLSVVSKVLTSLFLLVYSFTPSVMAIDDLYTVDNSQDISTEGISDPEWIAQETTEATQLTAPILSVDQPTADSTLPLEVSLQDSSVVKKLTTDKEDYAPLETVKLFGEGYLPLTEYYLVIYSTDTFTSYFKTSVWTDYKGTFTYNYQLDGIYRAQYYVDVLDLQNKVISSMGFTDSVTWICENDVNGANDLTGQKDLTRMCVNYSSLPTTINLTWDWDEIAWSGNNTGDACALFDTNGDGDANYALCTTVGGDPAVYKSKTLYSCNDHYADKCGNNHVVTSTSLCSASVESTDPFSAGTAYPKDTVGICAVQMSDLHSTNAKLLDVCSYPSEQPNSDPSDCIIATSDPTAKLEVRKILSPTTDPGLFNLLVDGSVIVSDITNGDTTGEQVVLASKTSTTPHTFGESAGTNTTLSNYSQSVVCRGSNGTGSIIPVTGTNPWTIQVNKDNDIVCTITNTRDTGHLIVQKTTLPASDPTSFSITASSSNGGVILGEASSTVTDSIDHDYSVTTGTYSVLETIPTGWAQTSNSCTNVTVAKGETKYCTIENKKLPVLTVEKVLNGISVPLSTFSFVVDGWNTIPFEADGSNNIFVTPGAAYSITETNPGANYNITYSTNCNGTLGYNQTATCTITNTQYGSLTIVKDANPNTTTSFDFTTSGTGLSDFSLIGDDSRTFTNLLPGEYSVTENSLSGWDLNNVTCSDRSDNTAISLSAGENVTCTFTNTQRGSISGHKYNDLDGEASTTTDRIGVAGWTIYIDANNNGALDAGEMSTVTDLNGSYTFTNLVPGVYQLREVLVTGWYKIYPTANYIDVTVDPGEQDSDNDFVNVEEGSITVYKNVDTDGDGDIDVTNSSDWRWDINGTGDYATGTTVSNVKPGTYTISEEDTTGYHVSNLVCDDETIGAVSTTDITMEAGDDVVCTFTNTRDTGTLKVVKNLINDNGGSLNEDDFNFNLRDASGAILSTTAFESDGTNEISLPTGTYSVDEVLHDGYSTSHEGCSEINVAYGDEATCTITNDDKPGTLIVQKVLTNDNGGNESVTDFDFTVNGTDTYTFEADGENSITVNAGTYNVAEVENSGYDTSYNGCTEITIPNGESRTCIITNNDIAPTITLIKEVQNDYAGTAGANDFGLTVGSTEVESGTPLAVNANESISLNENGLDGYEFVSMTGEGCPTELEGTVTLNEGEDLTCTITNRALPATINIHKDILNSSLEGEGVYTDTAFNVYLNGDVESAQQIRDTEIDPLVAEYSNLNSGSYTITEDPTDGYSFVGCYNPDEFIGNNDFGEELPNTFYVANGQTLDIVCENMIIAPELELAKSNNTGGADMLAGDNVVYTLTVTAPTGEEENSDKYVVKDVKVVDLPPEGFTYQGGSWTATSSVRGDLKLQNITPEPQYHSPATWSLGDMIEGEVVTLTYTANISNTQDAGNYEDLALARGSFLDGGRVLANQNTGIFVDTNVNVVEDIQEGQVLGVTDYEYPDTGAKTVITISAIVSAILGALLLLVKPKKKSTVLAMSAILILGGIALLTPTKAYADDGDIAVRIEQPESPYNKTDFKIGFVSLDLLGRELQIQCIVTTHGVFQTTTVKAGGNSGDCIVDNSVITGTGSYEFYVIASAGLDTATSQKVTVNIDLNGPSPVVGYEKTKPEDCKYTLSFTTANDGGQTQKVQIFRSTNRTFTANSSSLIAELAATSAQAITYTDTIPVCGTEYFYAIRAVDDANNTSTFVTDAQVIVVEPTTSTEEVINSEGTEAVQGETTTNNEETPQNGNDTNGEVQGETTTDNEAVEQSKFWNWFKYVLIGIGVASLGGIAYIYVSNRRNNKKAY